MATSDGHIRLIEAGTKAVIDLQGKPPILALVSDSRSAGKTFAAEGTTVDISIVADALDAGGRVIAHKAGVMIRSNDRSEHFYGIWTC